MKRPLEGVRIVDFTWVRAGPWGTRWLASLGAEVIKIEWPQPGLTHYRSRRADAYLAPGTEPNLNNNPYFSETHAGKLSVTVNMRTPTGLELVKKLIGIADVVVENFSAGVMDSWGLGYDVMRAQKPDIIYVSMAGLGHVGRNRDYKTDGPIVQPLSGLTQLAGLPDRPPARWLWAYMDDTGGMYAVICALAALHYRDRSGLGQYVDLAQVAAAMTLTGNAWLDYTVNGRPWRRADFPTGNRSYWPGTPVTCSYSGPTAAPHNAYRTAAGADGDTNAWCAIACFSDSEWCRFVDVMGSPTWALDPRFQTLQSRLANQDDLDSGIEAWTRQCDKYDVMRLCQSAGVHAMPVQDARDRVESDPQLSARGALQEVAHPAIGPYRYQTLPFTGSDMDLTLHRAGPLAGEHNVKVLCGLLGLSPQALRQGYADGTFWPAELPLEAYLEHDLSDAVAAAAEATASWSAGTSSPTPSTGDATSAAYGDLRVLEVGDVTSQWVARLFADLGADVIKVEPPGGSLARQTGPFYQDIPHPDRSLSFWYSNANKRSVVVDLESEAGRRALRELAQSADILIDGYAPGYLEGFGLGYDVLSQANPRLIMCSVTPFGQTGPWRDCLSSDLLHMAAGGFMALTGYYTRDLPDSPPITPVGGQAWFTGGHAAMIAIGAALHQRQRTGVGQYLDVSVHEACSLSTETHVPRYLARHEVNYRYSDLRPTPQWEYFRCRDGKYVSVHWVRFVTPEHIAMLAYWMDELGLADDLTEERYHNLAMVEANTEHIERLLVRFFANLDGDEAFHGLQARGFVAGISRAVEEIVEDGHWKDRGFLVSVEHPELGESFVYPGAYAIYSETPCAIRSRAPLLGEHTAEVLERTPALQSSGAT